MSPKTKPEHSPLSIIRMLWKQKLLIGACAVITCGIVLVVVMRLPPIYLAEASILVDSQKIPEQYVTSTVNTNVQDRLATISQEILSATRLQKVIDSFGLYSKEKKTMGPEEIIELMRKDISIKLEKGWTGGQPGAFRVGYQGSSPSVVADVANQLANLFIEENLKTRERQAEGTADFIDSELAEAKKTLDDEEAKLSKYKVQHNGELPQQESFLTQTMARLQVELQGNAEAISRAHLDKTTLQTALNVAEAEVTLYSRPLERGNAVITAEGTSLPASKPLKKSELLQQQYDAMAIRYKPDFPDLRMLQAEIARQRAIEASEAPALVTAPDASKIAPTTPAIKSLAPTPSVPPSKELVEARAQVETLKSQLANADQELANRNAERQQILHDINVYRTRLERIPLSEQELALVTRDYEISKANYKSLLDRKLAAGMATDMEHRQQAERFTLLDPARAPEKPTKPNRPALSIIGCLAGVGLAFGIGYGRELHKDTILGEWEIAADLPVLGRVPPIQTTESEGAGRPRGFFRIALVASAVLAVVTIGAVGVHFYLGWF